MNKYFDDKVMSNELVHKFPKEFKDTCVDIIEKIGVEAKPLSAIKVRDGGPITHTITFLLLKIYQLKFSYGDAKVTSASFYDKTNIPVLSLADVSSEEVVSLLKNVIEETIERDSLIENVKISRSK